MKHSELTGQDLHRAKSNTGFVSPVGIITPTVVGELYTDFYVQPEIQLEEIRR